MDEKSKNSGGERKCVQKEKEKRKNREIKSGLTVPYP